MRERHLLKIHSKILHHRLAAGEHGEIAEHGLAAVAIPRCLDRADLRDAAEFVDDECRKGLAGDVLGDDEQGLLGLNSFLEQRNDLLHAVDLVLVNENQRLA